MNTFLLFPRLVINTQSYEKVNGWHVAMHNELLILDFNDNEYQIETRLYKQNYDYYSSTINYYQNRIFIHWAQDLYVYDKDMKKLSNSMQFPRVVRFCVIIDNQLVISNDYGIEIFNFKDKLESFQKITTEYCQYMFKIDDCAFLYISSNGAHIYKKIDEKYQCVFQSLDEVNGYFSIKYRANRLYVTHNESVTIYHVKNYKLIKMNDILLGVYFPTFVVLSDKYAIVNDTSRYSRQGNWLYDLEKRCNIIGENFLGDITYLDKDLFGVTNDTNIITIHEIGFDKYRMILNKNVLQGKTIHELRILPGSKKQRNELCKILGNDLNLPMVLLGLIVDYCSIHERT
jgi:hypothetical protein